MYTVDIALCEHKPIPSPLTFYSKDLFVRGTVVSVKVKNVEHIGFVTACEPIEQSKSDIRTQSFQLKKIDKKKTITQCSETLLTLFEKSARTQGVPLPLVLECAIPMAIQERNDLLIAFLKRLDEQLTLQTYTELSYLEHDAIYRIDHYKTKIRDSLAKKQSVTIISPTIGHACHLGATVGKGLGQKCIVLTSDMTKKEMSLAFEKIRSNEPYLLIATAHYALCLPATNTLFILDQESHPNYYSFDTPPCDYSILLRNFAESTSMHTIIGDSLLRFESYKKLEEEKGVREFSIHGRFTRSHILQISTPHKDEEFKYIHSDVVRHLKMLKKNDHVYIHVPRAAVYSGMVCHDCKTVHSCSTCGNPNTVHEDMHGVRSIRCMHCRTKEIIPENTNVLCSNCGSWRMYGYGVTAKTIRDEIERYVQHPIYSTERESSKNIEKTIRTWEDTGGVLIGTEKCISLFTQQVTISIISSIDGWFAIPDIDVERRLLHILEPLTECTQKSIIIQTKSKQSDFFAPFIEGDWKRYIEVSLAERKAERHPPYTTFIMIRKQNGMTKEEAMRLEKHFSDYETSVYKVTNDIRVLIRVQSTIFYTSDTLQYELQSLYPYMIVEVNPLSLF